jgi:hypothetical protein
MVAAGGDAVVPDVAELVGQLMAALDQAEKETR